MSNKEETSNINSNPPPVPDKGTEANPKDAIPIPKAKLPDIYFYPPSTYYYRNSRGFFRPENQTGAESRLAKMGYSPYPKTGEYIAPLDEIMLTIRTDQDVDYVGPLAGYHVGVHQVCGQRILVTTEAKPIAPQAGDWSVYKGILSRGLGDEQCQRLFGWIQRSMEMYRQGRILPGQVLILCGPPGCGKTLLLDLLSTLFGGRMQKPHQFMSGGTGFNSELFGAELLVVDDEDKRIDARNRSDVAGFMKQVTATEQHRCHAKGREGVMLRPFWRVAIALNDDTQALQVLPHLVEGVEDKVMLLKFEGHKMPEIPGAEDQYFALKDKLLSELPAFAHFIRYEWQMPDEIRSSRFGVAQYHHPDLLAALGETSNEHNLDELITQAIFKHLPKAGGWEGTALELKTELLNTPYGKAEDGLLRYTNTVGAMLGALVRQDPTRFSVARISHNTKVWKIQPPPGIAAGSGPAAGPTNPKIIDLPDLRAKLAARASAASKDEAAEEADTVVGM